MVSCNTNACASPACGVNCTYEVCMDQGASITVHINKIPFTLADASSNSCDFNNQQINQIPFQVDGVSYSSIPVSVQKKYKTCRPVTIAGPACPPI